MRILPLIRSIARLVRRQGATTVVVASSIGAASGLANAGAVALIHDAIADGGEPSLRNFSVFLALVVTVPITRIWSQYLLLDRCLRSMVHLVGDLTSRIVDTPLRRLEEIGPSRVLTILTQDVPALTDTVVAVPTMLVNGAALAGCAAYLAWLSPLAAAVFGALTVGASSCMLLVVRGSRPLLRRARAEADRLFEQFRGHVAGIKELQLNGARRDDFGRDLRASAETYRGLHAAVTLIYTASSTCFNLLFLLAVGLLVFVVTHAAGVSVAVVGAYSVVLLYTMGPIGALTGLAQTLGRGTVALDNIDALGLSLQSAPCTERPSSPAAPHTWRHLELVDVAHRYDTPDGQTSFLLGPLTLRFERGRIVFVTGGNGSGKTTLVKLLCGLYIPDRGTVRIDGAAITPERRETFRQLFSAVFSDFHLFTRLFGFGERDMDAAARRQLEELQLRHVVDVRAGVFTNLNLSQGQRKRLALLVSRLEDRDVYVFDEWAADQDQPFRDYFYRTLLPELRSRGKTVFVVSHDERYYDVADRVLKLEWGRVLVDTAADVEPAAAAV